MTRYSVTLTVKSSCKPADNGEHTENSGKHGQWDYTLDCAGRSRSGAGSADSADMTNFAATLRGIIDAMSVLKRPCYIVVRTRLKSIGQTAAGIRSQGWQPKGRKAWSHTDLWKQLVATANKGGHKLSFEHVQGGTL